VDCTKKLTQTYGTILRVHKDLAIAQAQLKEVKNQNADLRGKMIKMELEWKETKKKMDKCWGMIDYAYHAGKRLSDNGWVRRVPRHEEMIPKYDNQIEEVVDPDIHQAVQWELEKDGYNDLEKVKMPSTE
jgi:hypothetical protein